MRILGAYLALNSVPRFSSRVDIQRARGISHTQSTSNIDQMLSVNENFG